MNPIQIGFTFLELSVFLILTHIVLQIFFNILNANWMKKSFSVLLELPSVKKKYLDVIISNKDYIQLSEIKYNSKFIPLKIASSVGINYLNLFFIQKFLQECNENEFEVLSQGKMFKALFKLKLISLIFSISIILKTIGWWLAKFTAVYFGLFYISKDFIKY